jgi:polysaccharide biosynthesis/export protein
MTRDLAARGVTLLILLAGGLGTPAAQGQHGQLADYLVGPQDVLAVTVINEPTLTGKFTVVADGTVTYPLLGAIKVGGLSLRAVERELTTKLADGFLEKPVVSVALDQFGSQQVLVAGEVRQPGSYPLTGRTTVLEVLLKAGAPTQNAGSEALVVRGGTKSPGAKSATANSPGTNGDSSTGASTNGHSANGLAAVTDSRVLRVNLDALQRGDLSQNLVLEAGDMLFVPRVEPPTPIYVTGQVKSPGAYQLAKGATVLQALAQAGGVTDRGSTGRVRIVRKVQGKSVELHAGLQDAVQPGDTIVVGRRFF